MCCKMVVCVSLPTILPAHGDNTNTGVYLLPSVRPSAASTRTRGRPANEGRGRASTILTIILYIILTIILYIILTIILYIIGKYHTINVPLKDADDAAFGKVTSLLARSIPDAFAPKALVVQVRVTLVYQLCGTILFSAARTQLEHTIYMHWNMIFSNYLSSCLVTPDA